MSRERILLGLYGLYSHLKGNRYYIYPPKEYQDKIAKLHGKKVKILLLHEEDEP